MSPDARDPRRFNYHARFPFVLGCIFLVSICYPALGELPGGVTFALAGMFACFPFWFGAAVTRQALVLDRLGAQAAKVLIICLIFLIAWAVLSVLDSGNPLRSGRIIVPHVAAFAIFFLVAGTVTTWRLGVLISVLCFGLAFSCLISLVAYFEPHLREVIYKGTDRASGFFKNPNQFGIAISTMLPVCAAALLGRLGPRWVWLACLVALMVGLILSGSKMNLLISSATLVFTLCSYSAVAYAGAKRIAMMALCVAAAAVLLTSNVILLSIFNPRALQLLKALTEEDGELHSIASRRDLWQMSLDQFQRDPIFGQGAGQHIGWPIPPLVTHSHNVLLDYMRTMGVPGLQGIAMVLLIIIMISVSSIHLAFKAAGATDRDRILSIGLSVGTLAYVVANFSSDSMGPSTSPFLWAVLFLGLTARLLLSARTCDPA